MSDFVRFSKKRGNILCDANKEIQSSDIQSFINNGDKSELFDAYFNEGLSVDKIRNKYGDFGVSRTTLSDWIKKEKERREKSKQIDELWNISKSTEKGDSPEKTAYLLEFISLSGIGDFSVVMGDYIWQLSRQFDLKEDYREQWLFADYLSAIEHLKDKNVHAYKLCNFAIEQCIITPFNRTPGGTTNWLKPVIDILFYVLADRPNIKTVEKVTQLLASLYNVQMLYYPNHVKEIDHVFHLKSLEQITDHVGLYRGWEHILREEAFEHNVNGNPYMHNPYKKIVESEEQKLRNSLRWAPKETFAESYPERWRKEYEKSKEYQESKKSSMSDRDKERLAIIQLFHKKFIDERNRNLSIIENTSKRIDKLEKEEKNG